MIELIIGMVCLFLGAFLEKEFIKFKLDSFDRTLKNTSKSIIRFLEDDKKDDSDKLKRVKNHLSYLSDRFRETKNLE